MKKRFTLGLSGAVVLVALSGYILGSTALLSLGVINGAFFVYGIVGVTLLLGDLLGFWWSRPESRPSHSSLPTDEGHTTSRIPVLRLVLLFALIIIVAVVFAQGVTTLFPGYIASLHVLLVSLTAGASIANFVVSSVVRKLASAYLEATEDAQKWLSLSRLLNRLGLLMFVSTVFAIGTLLVSP